MNNYQTQFDSIGRQRDLAQALVAQSLAPQQNQNALTGIARILAAHLANKRAGALDQQGQDLEKQMGMQRQQELSRVLGMTQDRPAETASPDVVGPPAPARKGMPLAQALMGSTMPEIQDMGLQGMMKVGNNNTPANIAEWNEFNSWDPETQNKYLNMKRSGFSAGGVQYDASGKQITPTDKVAKDKGTIAAAVTTAKEEAENAAALDAKSPVIGSMKYVMSQYEEIFPKIKTGGPMGTVGKASSVFDSQDAMRFENLNQQLSTELRTVFRIPGEGTLSDQEQKQYGLQLPSLNYDEETNRAILKDLETRAGMRTGGAPGGQGATPQIGAVEDGYEFLGGEPGDPKNWRPVGK